MKLRIDTKKEGFKEIKQIILKEERIQKNEARNIQNNVPNGQINFNVNLGLSGYIYGRNDYADFSNTRTPLRYAM